MQTAQDIKLEKPVTPFSLKETINGLIQDNKLMVFMKGTSLMPQCGYSAQVVGIMSELGVEYKAFNILEEPLIREGIKEFSQWPTIPQIYYKGEFIGGCDIVTELFQKGELEAILKA
ncbi:MAG: Grx4 family monothiol glutaredoxin [SAR324 cluster bacterium]|nr:Grx4 family monothiol glutaredoxin [SAR324 cluster bacterium]